MAKSSQHIQSLLMMPGVWGEVIITASISVRCTQIERRSGIINFFCSYFASRLFQPILLVLSFVGGVKFFAENRRKNKKTAH
jgi:hypothetical protein